ncbi:U32 family peptidase [bacterium]|nr:U32 family peptidase [bacterium]
MTIELLAPAGNLEKLKIAIQYGADAIYIAGQRFSLRSAANNFTIEDIKEALLFARQRGKKVYITVNAFLHDDEIDQLPEYLAELHSVAPDALICSDLGVVKLAQKHTGIPIHLSTQASVINSDHAMIWKGEGVKRIVVGRELTIKEAAYIKEKTGLEIEMFIHGAMCMAYSGHCAMSTYVAQRDSNRGGCIQNCRYLYNLYSQDHQISKSHVLSSKDLCGISLIDDLIKAEIDSIKIEGRMKSNLYVASTVRAYANVIKEINQGKSSNFENWKTELTKIPFRGYTEGSLKSEADLDSIYDPSYESGKDFKMAGTVLETDKDRHRFAFYVKNRLFPGDEIEVMTFDGSIETVTAKELINLADQSLTIAQPNSIIWLPLKDGIEAQNVARINRAATT